ncbi:Protein of unknown function [Methylomagnum ishizawai]|uniref:DUF1640 domain-containing protein n=1 Tax=Methylomagnum ishizawai TaxID=1760988 RepID=A0A1Y6D6Q4_9GAMM|nr:DUF1640 domain-containing protein [Methylomagnum ishizawai]SMF96034.1 Protein of unknown function [Methylomagnum ishizawai]
MATITFDTHKFIQTLQEAGFDPKQAEAVSKAFREATGEGEFATKRDVELVRQDVRELELRLDARFEKMDGKLTLVQWMLALVVAAEVVPLLASLFR